MSLRFEAEEGKEEKNTEEIRSRLFYEKSLEHPASMHFPLESEEKETIEKLVGKNRLRKTILTKTKALIFC